MYKKLNTPIYTRKCVDKYKKIKEEYQEFIKKKYKKKLMHKK